MNKSCEKCGSNFVIDEKDLKFYAKMDVPAPKICFDCRQQQKMAFRNERKLYHNVCGLCKKPMVSIYAPGLAIGQDKPYTVYCTNCWWGDGWNPMDYGREFDFSRPFFEQFKELWDEVPKLSLLSLGNNINSDFCHDALGLQSCYLIFDGEQAKDSYYGETFSNLKDCCDFLIVQRCELCYECVNCNDCYNLNYSRYCYNCSDSNFLLNCRGCRNCFGCVNLQQKQYHVLNKPYSREDYGKFMAGLQLGNYEALQEMKRDFEKFVKKFPHKAVHGIMNDNVTGDNLNGCKDTFDSYDCANLRDCRYCSNMLMGGSDCYDVNVWGDNLSLAYNSAGVGAGGQNVIATYYAAFGIANIFHCIFCLNGVSDLFGCVGLQHKKYCILNKQYSEEEYKALLPKIIEHMGWRAQSASAQVERESGFASSSETELKKKIEWSEFFPPFLSAFGYNETVADEYYPLTKERALASAFKWRDSDPKEYQKQIYKITENIREVPDEIMKETLACIGCGKNYKINAHELNLYRKKTIPIPRKCFDCRHKDRLNLRNPRKLWDRKCEKCEVAIRATYETGRPEKVYCEKCFLEVVY